MVRAVGAVQLLRRSVYITTLLGVFAVVSNSQTTHVVPADGNIQAAYNAAKCGDTITLAAGANFDFSVPLQITAKAPCTNTERDYITIIISDPSGIPAVLNNYPRDLTRPTTAMAAKMPKLRTTSSEPVVNIARGAKWVRFEGIEFTAVDNGVQVIRLVQSDLNGEVRAVNEMPDHISFRRCWFHPPQETGIPMNSTNIARSVENAMYLDMNNGELLNNAFTGFAGKNKYGGEAGRNITSTNWLITLGENNVVRGNFFGAWTYAIFSGGSGIPRWAVTGFGTVSNCQGNPATQCDFSNVSGLTVGTPISIFVTTSTSQNKWGAAFIKSINGQTVTFEKPLCQSFDGSNSCTGQNGTPANGDRVQWDGLQPKNYLFERNAFVHDPEWRTLLGECGGKGYDEIKSGINFTFNGNLYEGCSGHTVTVRNQNGDFPWASVSGLRRTNNYYRNSNNIMVGYCQDVIPTRRSSGLVWINNLAVGVELNPQIRTGTLSGNWTNCDSPTVTNNTVVWSAPGNNFNNFGVMNNPVIKDNIMHMGQNACWRPDTSVPMINCWPNGDIRNNGLINTGIRDYEQEWWLGSWPNQTVLRTWDGIFVRNTFDATGDYHLAPNSPLKGKGSNGSDPGANVDVVMAAVFGNEPLPLPSPSPLPSVSPSPSPQPTSSPTPAASPVPTATPTPPSGQIQLSGQTFFSIGGGLFPFTTVVLSDASGRELQRIQEQEDAKYSFTVAPGTYQISVVQDGYNMSPSKIYLTNVDASTGGLSILNFTVGPVGAFQAGAPMCVPSANTCPPSGQPSPSPSTTPVSSPSPVPTPTIIPSPSPSPSVPQPSPSPSVPVPSPSPAPVPPQPSPSPVAIEVWDEPWPSSKTQQDAIWKRLHESGWKCIPNVPATSPTGNRIRCWRVKP